MNDHDHTPLTFPRPPVVEGTSPSSFPHDEPDDAMVFDALADMFLGAAPDEHALPDEPHQAIGWSVELLLMGHLPVRARPWASQYAAARAHQDGVRVALVRIGGGYGSVELFGSAKGTLSVAAAPSLAGAIERARELASVCLVQVDDASHAPLIQTDLIDAITLLIGANSAAVVDAYRALKSLAARTGAELPSLRIGVMGSDGDDAREAVRKLSDATEAFLGSPIHSSLPIERMGPTGAVSLYGDRVNLTAHETISMIAGEDVAIASEDDRVIEPEAQPSESESQHIAHAAAPTPEPKPFVHRGAALAGAGGIGFSSEQEPSLVSFVEGLISIDVECPYDRDTVLAADRDGALHVLRRVDTNPEPLLMALGWAEAHRAILSRATNGRVRSDSEVRAHAFVDSAQTARAMKDAHAGRLVVHAIVRVPEGARWLGLEY